MPGWSILLAALLAAAALGNLWLHRRFAAGTRSAPLGLAAAIAAVAACCTLATFPSENVFLLLVLWLPVQVLIAARWFLRWLRRRPGPPSWRARAFGGALVTALPVTLLLAAGETWFRFGRDATDAIAYTKVSQRWIERHYRCNTATFRDDVEYAPAIAPGKRRVTFLGDSFTAGHGIADVNRRAANLVRARHPEWEVHVLAKNGLDTPTETQLVEVVTAHGYALDEVVLCYCFNDAMDVLPHWRAVLEDAARVAKARWAVFDSSWLLDTLYFRVAIVRLPGVGDFFSFVGEAYRGEPWQQHRRHLRALRDAIVRGGGRLRVVTWPLLNRLGPDYPYAAAHATLAAFWQAEGVPHLDLLPVLRDMEPARVVVSAVDAHPNEFANELAAAAIDRWLAPIVAAGR